jgi:maleylpyruvate isomerase
LDRDTTEALTALRASTERLLTTVAALDDHELPQPSRLPGWTRAHVLTHLARSSDSRTRLLAAARSNVTGRQYESEESRNRDIETGAQRDATIVRVDLHEAFERFFRAVAEHPDDRWDAPAEWLGVGEAPVRRTIPSLRREVEFHHVDLGAAYGPDDWPPEFVTDQLDAVLDSMSRKDDAPALTIELGDGVRRIKDGGSLTVSGEPAHVLAWLSGRGDGAALRTRPPRPLPEAPPLA